LKIKTETVISLADVEVAELLKEVQGRGYYVAKTPLAKSGQVFASDLKRLNGRRYKFAVVSDSHIGSRQQQLSYLWDFYRICGRRGISTIFHCGDLVEGSGRVYRGQEYDIFCNGADAQTKYVVAHYPKIRGVKTKVISGNHCMSFQSDAGYNIVQAICNQRSDMEYLGDYLAYVTVDNIKIALMHGHGGGSYARSYRLQKVVEQFSSENKPHFLFMGHYHSNTILSGYRNVEAVLMPCFQAQTDFETTRGLNPVVAGLIVEIQTDDSGLAKVKYEMIPYYRFKKNDF
jgi:DNA polymerase II small subunit/DNA polymerase delta subunit B